MLFIFTFPSPEKGRFIDLRSSCFPKFIQFTESYSLLDYINDPITFFVAPSDDPIIFFLQISMNVTQTMADVNRYVITQLAHITVLVISTTTSIPMDTHVCPAMGQTPTQLAQRQPLRVCLTFIFAHSVPELSKHNHNHVHGNSPVKNIVTLSISCIHSPLLSSI